MKSVACFMAGCLITGLLQAQSGSYTDPAQAYNRLLIEKGTGGYTRAGTFKVIGTPYLFGDRQVGNVYGKGETGTQVTFGFNTYTQQLEIVTGNEGQGMLKSLPDIDSFRITKGTEVLMTDDLLFINPSLVGSTDKAFVQVVQRGARFSLFKVYRSQLGYVSTNYVQSELRQFDVDYDFYYTDTQKPGLKKLKKNGEGIKKEFKGVKDLSGIGELENYAVKPEEVLKIVFTELNK